MIVNQKVCCKFRYFYAFFSSKENPDFTNRINTWTYKNVLGSLFHSLIDDQNKTETWLFFIYIVPNWYAYLVLA